MKDRDRLDTWKDRWAILQSIATITAFLAGGWWAYKNFSQTRQDHPKLQIVHKIQHYSINKDQRMLVIDELLTNTGPVMLRLCNSQLRVIQVLPLPVAIKRKLASHSPVPNTIEGADFWPILNSPIEYHFKKNQLVFEPGEGDQIRHEVWVPSNVEVVNVYSYYENPTADSSGNSTAECPAEAHSPAETAPRNSSSDKAIGWRAITTYDFRAVVSSHMKP